VIEDFRHGLGLAISQGAYELCVDFFSRVSFILYIGSDSVLAKQRCYFVDETSRQGEESREFLRAANDAWFAEGG
jgi:hypothetical protein